MEQVKKTRILLVDDHQLVLDGLRNILDDVAEVHVVADANNGKQAIEILQNLRIQVVLMDIDMPEMGGIEATKLIKRKFPDIKILILSMHNEKGVIQTVIDAGADGYLLKNSSQNELVEGIKSVCQGKKFFTPEVTMTLLKTNTEMALGNDGEIIQNLTERELEILKLISEGLSNKEIGEKLFISHRTVDTHRTNLMKKLDVHNIAGLIRFALKNKLV